VVYLFPIAFTVPQILVTDEDDVELAGQLLVVVKLGGVASKEFKFCIQISSESGGGIRDFSSSDIKTNEFQFSVVGRFLAKPTEKIR